MSANLTFSRRIYSRLPEPVKSQFRITRRAVRAWMHPGHPRVFLNSIPKAGTHLLTTLLERLGFHLYCNQPFNPDLLMDYDAESFRPRLLEMRPGEYIIEHLPWLQGAEDVLLGHGLKVVFIYRDPRAAAVSFARYVAEQHPSHRLHAYFKTLPDLDSRVRATIEGIPNEKSRNGHGRPPHGRLYDAFLPWKDSPRVFSASFEQLVGERGGGSAEMQRKTVQAFLDYLGISGGDRRVRRVAEAVFNESAATFRAAQIAGWRREVSPDTVELLDRALERQIRDWGYA